MEGVRKFGFTYVDFDEEGCAPPSESPADWILVGEYSLGLLEEEIIKRIKEDVGRLEKMIEGRGSSMY